MADEPDGLGEESQRRKFRLMGYSTVASGALVVGATRVLPDPYDPLVFGLAFLAIATMVFEYTESRGSGLSLGFVVSGVIVWVYPVVAPEPSLAFAGVVLVLLGLLNALAPQFMLYFVDVGRRMGGKAGEGG